eukprot:9699369-Alexandrium_andersonii.AAC.1
MHRKSHGRIDPLMVTSFWRPPSRRYVRARMLSRVRRPPKRRGGEQALRRNTGAAGPRRDRRRARPRPGLSMIHESRL